MRATLQNHQQPLRYYSAKCYLMLFKLRWVTYIHSLPITFGNIVYPVTTHFHVELTLVLHNFIYEMDLECLSLIYYSVLIFDQMSEHNVSFVMWHESVQQANYTYTVCVRPTEECRDCPYVLELHACFFTKWFQSSNITVSYTHLDVYKRQGD